MHGARVPCTSCINATVAATVSASRKAVAAASVVSIALRGTDTATGSSPYSTHIRRNKAMSHLVTSQKHLWIRFLLTIDCKKRGRNLT
jgi:hypothetical protein